MNRLIRIACLALAAVLALSGQQKKRVAVLDFDYATVHSGVSGIFGTNVDVGKGISDLLVDRLVTSGVYSVIERKALDKILAEQNFSNSDRADPSSAAKIGRVLGVSAIIIGSITQFGRDDQSTSVGGGAVGGITRRFGIGGVRRSEAKAVVAVSARMVDTNTGEILAVATGKGESQRSGTSLLGAGGSSGTSAGGAVDMRSSNFASTILGEATSQAVSQLAGLMDHSAAKLPTTSVSVQGLVADATGGTLILNIGSRVGLKVGDRLAVARKIREIKDPATGKVLRTVEDTVGEVTITEVDEQSSVGKYTGGSPAKVGDSVKTAP
ncbi:MAG: curli production assembly protein CsgG [Acidobacteriales bacterium]|nr:MAG: curli production assembly protein CsgG [Terriglobales bacterium]